MKTKLDTRVTEEPTRIDVKDIFESVDLSGVTAGTWTTFVRLAGCNLRCCWCETPYALTAVQGETMDIAAVLEAVQTDNVTVTGGEPLAQGEASMRLIRELMTTHLVNLETNGSMDFRPLLRDKFAPHLRVTMDWKLPSSKMEEYMNPELLKALRARDVLKLVCGSERDLDRAEVVIKEMQRVSHAKCYITTVFGKLHPRDVVDRMRIWSEEHELDMTRIRLQLQMRSIIWGQEQRVI
ncbi:MAG: 7-carboxy-7-deazaguanine synthase QueE [Akkermansia sp.]|nr:7-carboxy-7-deazaguanine synthase QueE [Akkermansia sp.]